MSDRELLEMAAKAAGLKILRDPDDLPRNCTGMHPTMSIFAAPVWNPRDDDGDSRRLQVKLRIQIEFCRTMGGKFTEVHAYPSGRGDCAGVAPLGEDDDAATRMAVLLAAAELGRQMP